MFIDWEFASYNCRGFDLAMHLSETAIARGLKSKGAQISEELTDNPPNLFKFCKAYIDGDNKVYHPMKVKHLLVSAQKPHSLKSFHGNLEINSRVSILLATYSSILGLFCYENRTFQLYSWSRYQYSST